MPIEIRELVIKAVVVDKPVNQTELGSAINKHEVRRLKDDIVQECMRKVNDILEKQTER